MQNTAAESQESLSTDNSLFLHPVLWASGPYAGLEHRTSLTRHYAIPMHTNDPPSLCPDHSHTATSHSVSLVSSRIPCYPLAFSPWGDSLAICWMLAVSPWGDFLTIRWTLAVSLWEDTLAIRWMLAVSPWEDLLTIHWALAVSLWEDSLAICCTITLSP